MQSTRVSYGSSRISSHSSIARAIVIGGTVVGLLDAIDGVAYFGITTGMNPIQVLQYIASGAFGARAFDGGLATAGVGAVIHFALAYAFTAAYVVAWSRVNAIRRNHVVSGLAWGACVWLIMNLFALPLSNVAASPITPIGAVHGIIGHGLFVGLAAAIVAQRVLSQPSADRPEARVRV